MSVLQGTSAEARAKARLVQLHQARDLGRLTLHEYQLYAWHTLREFGIGVTRAHRVLDAVCAQCGVSMSHRGPA